MRDPVRFPVAVFLDRDGTVNVDKHYTHRVADLAFEDGALQALKRLAEYPVRVILVTNQSGVALGYYTEEDMRAFHRELVTRVHRHGGRIDGIYYCPHLERTGCGCSKPEPGLLRQAAFDFGLDLEQCWMVGDKRSDVAAGKAVGCKTVLVRTGKAGRWEEDVDAVADFTRDDLYQAVQLIWPALVIP